MDAKEINRGYLDHIRNVSQPQTAATESIPRIQPPGFWSVATLRGVMPSGIKRAVRFIRYRLVTRVLTLLDQVLTTGLLVLTSLVLGAFLKAYLLIKNSRTPVLNRRAIKHVPEFIEQYPLHLYPVVCKSFEFAFLEERVHRLLAERARFIELAIGEGTFSARIFPRDAEVVGLDLSPYSLRKAVELPHVKQALICDCLQPPISSGYFDVVLANNFLHHVTSKETTLSNWSRVAKKLIFNENTPYWASGWVKPFILRTLGFKRAAQQAADKVESAMIQHLEPKDVLTDLVKKHFEIVEVSSYMSERTFFLCAVYSFIMRCYGPPTPAHLKSFFMSASMRWLTVPLATGIASMLIEFDQFQDRSRDSFVSYVCESRYSPKSSSGNYLVCTRCGNELDKNDACEGCGKQYFWVDQMLFLLPEDMEYVEKEYKPEAALSIPKEHL